MSKKHFLLPSGNTMVKDYPHGVWYYVKSGFEHLPEEINQLTELMLAALKRSHIAQVPMSTGKVPTVDYFGFPTYENSDGARIIAAIRAVEDGNLAPLRDLCTGWGDDWYSRYSPLPLEFDGNLPLTRHYLERPGDGASRFMNSFEFVTRGVPCDLAWLVDSAALCPVCFRAYHFEFQPQPGERYQCGGFSVEVSAAAIPDDVLAWFQASNRRCRAILRSGPYVGQRLPPSPFTRG